MGAIGCLSLSGCLGLGLQNMTAEQIKATNGMTTCTTLSTMSGSGSTISVNSDDIRKGATSNGKVAVTCGTATIVIDSNVGVAYPPGTTVVIPQSTVPIIPK